VVPSYYESFGMVALEAMACGVPVIASAVGGLPETVRDGESGLLVPDNTPAAFADGLELLLGDPELRWELSTGARALAEQYSWANVAEQVEAVYHDLVMQYKGVIGHGLAGSI
jgi:D-inositol-3-phosphate glycosyltransferase